MTEPVTAPVTALDVGPPAESRTDTTTPPSLPPSLPLSSLLSILSYLEQVADWRDVVNAAIDEGEDILKAGSKEGLRPSLHPLLFHDWRGREGG